MAIAFGNNPTGVSRGLVAGVRDNLSFSGESVAVATVAMPTDFPTAAR
jgi:hypothetical protein